jgi:hypothetical protein
MNPRALLVIFTFVCSVLLGSVAEARRHIRPCVNSTGQVSWVRDGASCPTGSTAIPPKQCTGACMTCDELDYCPAPEDTVDVLVCCEMVSGDADCFEVIETILECPPGNELAYCQWGESNADGTVDCYWF